MNNGGFTRTRFGLLNLHQFLKVDAVVFVEGGGSSFSLEGVLAGDHSLGTQDIMFWSGLFNIFTPHQKLEVRSVGSCKTLRSICDLLGNDVGGSVKVCMDSDLTPFWGPRYRNAIYSRGYSWENELVEKDILVETFFSLFATQRDALEQAIREEIDLVIGELRSALRKYVVLDVALGGVNCALFDRARPRAPIETKDDLGKPVVNENYLMDRCRTSLRQSREKMREYRRFVIIGLNSDNYPERHCFGHLAGKIFYALIAYLGRKFSRWHNTPEAVVLNVGISHFLNAISLDVEDDRHSYYQTALT